MMKNNNFSKININLKPRININFFNNLLLLIKQNSFSKNYWFFFNLNSVFLLLNFIFRLSIVPFSSNLLVSNTLSSIPKTVKTFVNVKVGNSFLVYFNNFKLVGREMITNNFYSQLNHYFFKKYFPTSVQLLQQSTHLTSYDIYFSNIYWWYKLESIKYIIQFLLFSVVLEYYKIFMLNILLVLTKKKKIYFNLFTDLHTKNAFIAF